MKIVTLRVGARAKEGKGGGGGPIFSCLFEFQHGAFASKTFARPKKTFALQATIYLAQTSWQ